MIACGSVERLDVSGVRNGSARAAAVGCTSLLHHPCAPHSLVQLNPPQGGRLGWKG